jgi:hypothetical protein
MGDIADTADSVYRDNDTPGVPHKPIKSEIRSLFGMIDARILGLIDTSVEVAITSATVLTSADYGKSFLVSGAGPYNITMPSPIPADTGKLIFIQISPGAARSPAGLYTLVGNIDGSNRVMWRGESAVLRCTGAAFEKLSGDSMPMCGAMYANAIQALVNGTYAECKFNTQSAISPCYDAVNMRFKAPRPSVWQIDVCTPMAATGLTAARMGFTVNQTGLPGGLWGIDEYVGGTDISPLQKHFVNTFAAAGDFLAVIVRVNGTSNWRVDFDGTNVRTASLSYAEFVQW